MLFYFKTNWFCGAAPKPSFSLHSAWRHHENRNFGICWVFGIFLCVTVFSYCCHWQKTLFALYLEIRLKKTSECFVQWRNRKTSKYYAGLKKLTEEQSKEQYVRRFLLFFFNLTRQKIMPGDSILFLKRKPKSSWIFVMYI